MNKFIELILRFISLYAILAALTAFHPVPMLSLVYLSYVIIALIVTEIWIKSFT